MAISKQGLVWLVVLATSAIALLFIIYPKPIHVETDEGVTRCACFGNDFWYGTRCVGFRFNCSVAEREVDEEACDEPSCAAIVERVRARNDDVQLAGDPLRGAGLGTDVILVMDTSNSMQGEKLLAAKESAQRLISVVDEGDRIGIVSFSDDATVVQDFSDDKMSLTEGIMSITVSGGTNYLPALTEAEQVFRQQTREAKKGIIFLSDGIPSDNHEAIVAKARSLWDEGIAVFTISFGIEDNGETNILREMAGNGTGGSSANRWYRSFTDTQSIADAFYEAWQEIANMEVITIEPAFEGTSFMEQEQEAIGVLISMQGLMLTGSRQEDSLCVPQLEVTIIAAGEDGEERNFSLVSSDYQYRLPLGSLSPGTYGLRAEASLQSNHEGNCLFTGESSLGVVTVLNDSGTCAAVTCDAVLEQLGDFDLATRWETSFPRSERPGRVAVLMDSSESMRPYQGEVSRAVSRLNRLLAESDERALITFADEASLVQPLTRDEESFEESLRGVVPQGTTRLIPALKKARLLFGSGDSGRDVTVIFTDGMPHDAEGRQGIIDEADRLVSGGSCVFVIGYGTELLRDGRNEALFRDVASRSWEVHGCGAYAYAPSSDDLALLVTEMFGGERSGNDSIRIISEMGSRRFLLSDSLSVRARVVGARTGVHVPVVSGEACVPAADLDVTLLDAKGVVVADVEERVRADGSYEARVDRLAPGRYVLRLDASLPVAGCDIATSQEEEFIVIGGVGSAYEGLLLGLVAVVASLLFLSASRVRRAFLQK
ncbi:VWA domain-containing protein [Candidatus Woesearchaeota archaeon]|nr:VWA domain-containing protein [Candidatus Woesearchaeota archaeon]